MEKIINCVCCGSRVKDFHSTSEIMVSKCNHCGTLYANHITKAETSDYNHIWKDLGEDYIKSLENTRFRQARVLVDKLKKNSIQNESVFDFGTGRGWFLDALKNLGFKNFFATDGSQEALEMLRHKGIQTIETEISAKGEVFCRIDKLSKSPDIISFMDVIEHFDPTYLVSSLSNILKPLTNRQVLVIKVPIVSGIFFLISLLLSRIGFHSPLHQLFQVGTFPAHYTYFSVSGVKHLLAKLNFKLIDSWGDPEFEALELKSRVSYMQKFPQLIAGIIGICVLLIVRIFSLYDAWTFLAVKDNKN